MIRHEMLAFYKALYSVCLKPYASKLPTAFIQKEFPSFVWCISCLISENNVLMHQCANKRKGYQTTKRTKVNISLYGDSDAIYKRRM